MTATLSPSDEAIRDFSERVNVKFRIDGDVFEGVPGIPTMTLLAFANDFGNLNESEFKNQPDAFRKLFELVLTPESFDVFMERMSDPRHPISMTQVMRILPWLMEEYGMRPTEPSSTSSNGSPNLDAGTSSTVNASHAESSLSISPQIAS